jgi:hypothetical protein
MASQYLWYFYTVPDVEMLRTYSQGDLDDDKGELDPEGDS